MPAHGIFRTEAVRGARYTCVGSGTCVPSASRGPACHLLQAGELRLLLDLGSGSLRSLARLGEAYEDLDAVGLTHRHLDHVADLLPLVFALRNTPGLGRTKPLLVFGYAGLRSDLERLAAVHGDWVLEPGFELEIRELCPGQGLSLSAAGVRAHVTAHAVSHTPEAVGFRIDLTGTKEGEAGSWTFAYSGDSGATPSLVPLAAGVDLFVCECAFPDGEGVKGHLTPSELLPIAAAAGARRTVATHLYPIWDERGVERLWSEALTRLDRGVQLEVGWDGLQVELQRPEAKVRCLSEAAPGSGKHP